MDKHLLNVKVAVIACIEDDGKILLQRRLNTGWRDGWYGLVGGHADAGESYTDAMCREIKEEIGVEVLSEDVEFQHLLIFPARISDCDRIFVYFRVTKWKGTPFNSEPEKCDDIRWFDKNSLPDNIIPIVNFGLQKIYAGQKYSEYGWEDGQDTRV